MRAPKGTQEALKVIKETLNGTSQLGYRREHVGVRLRWLK